MRMNESTAGAGAPRPQRERFFTGPLALIFMTIFIDLIGFGIVIPILPLYAQSELFQASPFWIGQLTSIFSWMQFFFTPVIGQLSDRYGRRPILFWSLIGSGLGYLVVGAGTTFAVIFVGRMISGVTGGSISAAQAYVADVTTTENRAKGMGLFGAAFGLGFIFGPALAGVLSKYGISVPFYFAAGLSLANAFAVYLFLPESLKPELRSRETHRAGRIAVAMKTLADPQFRVIAGVYFLLIMAFSIMTTAYVLFTAHVFGYNAEQNGYLFAFVGVISVIMQGVVFGFAAKRFGESRLTTIGCVVMAASLFATPFVAPEQGGLAGLLAVTAFVAIGNAFATPSLTSLGSKNAAAHEQGRAMGVMQSGASLARAIGPTLCGVLLNNAANSMDHSTIVRTYWTAAAIMLVAFLCALFLLKNIRTAAEAAI
jgi:DHA1 family tetracycline resistance protein-like MFS transporter